MLLAMESVFFLKITSIFEFWSWINISALHFRLIFSFSSFFVSSPPRYTCAERQLSATLAPMDNFFPNLLVFSLNEHFDFWWSNYFLRKILNFVGNTSQCCLIITCWFLRLLLNLEFCWSTSGLIFVLSTLIYTFCFQAGAGLFPHKLEISV